MLTRANPAKAIPELMNQLITSSIQKDEDLRNQMKWIRHHFPTINRWHEELLDHFSELERHHHHHQIDGDDVSKRNDIKAVINRIKASFFKLSIETELRIDSTDPVPGKNILQKKQKDLEISGTEKKIIAKASENPTVKNLRVSYERLEKLESRICFLFLAVFPENAVLKKRLLIYWWIGEGLITKEEEGEEIFKELLKLELIMPYANYHDNTPAPIVSKCQIHPWVRYMLITLAKDADVFDTTTSRRACLIHDPKHFSTTINDNLRTIFNVNKRYLSSVNFELLTKLKKLVVFQLGRWQDDPTHHIEVEDESFLLKGLRGQKHLKYLSLRGISRITSIPASIFNELVSLEILDLKACHNLESLPSNISSLKKLTHLDVSECYLLQDMPKTLEKLYSLQVLKGFIIGKARSKKTRPCRISDLTKLKKLERLSIHIGVEASSQSGVFKGLESLTSLKNLKISWGVENPVDDNSLSLPSSLQKLDLECVPHDKIPEWLKPSKVGQLLKKLYIKGGELKSLDHDDGEHKWNNVEILRLKYLKNMKLESLDVLKKLFPSLKCVQLTKTGQVHPEQKVIRIDLTKITPRSALEDQWIWIKV